MVEDSQEVPCQLARHEYLRLLWRLSLSLPLEYIDKHPFDIPTESGVLFFQIPERGIHRFPAAFGLLSQLTGLSSEPYRKCLQGRRQ